MVRRCFAERVGGRLFRFSLICLGSIAATAYGADVGLALKVIGLHIGGQLATGFWGECFLQPGAGFELGRGQGSIPSAGLGGQGSGRCASHGGAAQVAAHRTLRRLGAWTNKHGGENGEQRWEAIVEAAGLRPGRKVGL